MLFLIRTALTRDLGNMGNVALYRHSHIGTKDLIERYIDSALETLDTLLDFSTRLPTAGGMAAIGANETVGGARPAEQSLSILLSPRHMLEQVLQARQAFGRSALLLSGGGTFGMNHNGVLKALWERRLLPRIISGASAGSIVSAIMCTRTDEQIPELLEEFCKGDLDVFEDSANGGDSVMRKVTRFLTKGALYEISHLERIMRQSLGELTFQEAYNRTRRILNITVSSASLYELPRLLNYVTAPNVLIWSAV
jgi:TAG lipase / steryl ester hydrolase / phospholipase A2 / LPA acyltransferase